MKVSKLLLGLTVILGGAALLAIPQAFAQSVGVDQKDINKDKHDIHQDTKDIDTDLTVLKEDSEAVKADRTALKAAYASGDHAMILAAKQQLHADAAKDKAEKHDIAKDARDRSKDKVGLVQAEANLGIDKSIVHDTKNINKDKTAAEKEEHKVITKDEKIDNIKAELMDPTLSKEKQKQLEKELLRLRKERDAEEKEVKKLDIDIKEDRDIRADLKDIKEDTDHAIALKHTVNLEYEKVKDDITALKDARKTKDPAIISAAKNKLKADHKKLNENRNKLHKVRHDIHKDRNDIKHDKHSK